jgi:CubicO group peptidase (beta-lactamase class C family)
VLGLIIEKISGLSYDDYIQKHITEPAGMENTFCYDISKPVPNLAIGYSKRNLTGETQKDRIENDSFTPTKGGPAGGGYSTVEDLLCFDTALRAHKLLDEKHFTIMTTGKVDRDNNRKYAYLFEERFINGHRVIGHGGGAPGINSQLHMYMDLGYTVAVMSNYDPPSANRVADKIMEWLIER